MHELSVMTQLIQAALNSLNGYDIVRVNNLYLDVGELTFLNPEQLKFSFQVLTKDTALHGAELVINERKAEVTCESCGYEGALKEPEGDHFGFLRLFCPKCGAKVKILSGKECVLKRIEMELVENEEKDPGEFEDTAKAESPEKG
jgi:hydrogenase nickel incorporation protein HypA/HybF